MKGSIKKIAYRLCYPILLIPFFRNFFRMMHHFSLHVEDAKNCRKLSPEWKVLHGPFKNLRYAVAEAAGSALLPKLAGTYEDELHHCIETCISNRPKLVINMGCGEGYYANGIAMRLPDAIVWAIDTDSHALMLCKEQAKINGFANRVITATTYPLNQCEGKSGWIFCDCEGCELDMFTPETIPYFQKFNLIIELHDCNNDEISKNILPLFAKSHLLSLIKSNPNKSAAEYPHLRAHVPWLKNEKLDERNGIIMYWAFLEAKN